MATLASAIVHAADIGAKVINISVTSCLSAADPTRPAFDPRRRGLVRRDHQGRGRRGGRQQRGEDGCAQNPCSIL